MKEKEGIQEKRGGGARCGESLERSRVDRWEMKE